VRELLGQLSSALLDPSRRLARHSNGQDPARQAVRDLITPGFEAPQLLDQCSGFLRPSRPARRSRLPPLGSLDHDILVQRFHLYGSAAAPTVRNRAPIGTAASRHLSAALAAIDEPNERCPASTRSAGPPFLARERRTCYRSLFVGEEPWVSARSSQVVGEQRASKCLGSPPRPSGRFEPQQRSTHGRFAWRSLRARGARPRRATSPPRRAPRSALRHGALLGFSEI
jgi:hypothetical protein